MRTDRFSKLLLSDRLRLRNRVVVPPMASETADADGFVTDQTLNHYERLAESGAGLIFVEYTYVNRTGRSEPNQVGIEDEAHLMGLAALAKTIHRSGAVAGIQLTHSGGKSSRDLTGGTLLGPSNIAVPTKDRELEAPTAMRLDQVKALVDEFAQAAARAQRAGFDIVELHCAHGYGLNQWLSSLTNQRTDLYGGSLYNRARLILEIVAAIRSVTDSKLLIATRIPGQDLLPGGLTREEMIQVAQWLEKAGVAIIDVSSGLGGWRRPIDRRGEGYLLAEAQFIQSQVGVPVIGVGGIETGTFIDQVIGEGQVSLTAVGRAILKDPAGWRRAILTPETPEVVEAV